MITPPVNRWSTNCCSVSFPASYYLIQQLWESWEPPGFGAGSKSAKPRPPQIEPIMMRALPAGIFHDEHWWGPAVPTGNIELNENMEFASPLSSPPPGASGTSYLSCRRVSCLQISSHAPSGESRTSAPTRSAASLGEAAYTDVADRLLWAWLCGAWSDWRSALVIVKPETVIGWHRKGFPAVLVLEGSPRPARPAADF